MLPWLHLIIVYLTGYYFVQGHEILSQSQRSEAGDGEGEEREGSEEEEPEEDAPSVTNSTSTDRKSRGGFNQCCHGDSSQDVPP